MTPISNATISKEIENLRRDHPRVSISAATNFFLSASYQRTPYTRIRLTLTFPVGYPQKPLIVDVLADDVVPPGLKKKMERDLGIVSSGLVNEGQVCAVFEKLVKFVDSNKFVPCWRELKRSVDFVSKLKSDEDSGGSYIRIMETEGKIKLNLQGARYFYTCYVTVDDGYPSTLHSRGHDRACDIRMCATNLPPKIEQMLTAQAQDLVRRMSEEGMSAETALKMSNPIRTPKNFNEFSKTRDVPVRLTQEALKGLKHDTETLKIIGDLREVNASTVQGNAAAKSHGYKERKDARRRINKMTQSEMASDIAEEEKEKRFQMEKQAKIAGFSTTEEDGFQAQPSLLPLIHFLTNHIHRLPLEKCPVCTQATLPCDPTELKALYQSPANLKTIKEKREWKKARAKCPVRTYCGCWYHHDCLDKFMTEPPFGSECRTDGCARRVYHPDWPSSIRELEREWANKQARIREIEDASMFL